jgi:hypothetical protein
VAGEIANLRERPSDAHEVPRERRAQVARCVALRLELRRLEYVFETAAE